MTQREWVSSDRRELGLAQTVKPSTWITVPRLSRVLKRLSSNLSFGLSLYYELSSSFYLRNVSNGEKVCVPLLPRNWLPFGFVNMVQSQKRSPGKIRGFRALGVLGSEPVHSPSLDALRFPRASLIHNTMFSVSITHWEKLWWYCSRLAFICLPKTFFSNLQKLPGTLFSM